MSDKGRGGDAGDDDDRETGLEPAADDARSTSATAASGDIAALSIRPSRKSERATAPKLAVRLRQRRTTATRITSSQRPGRAIPPTDAAPPAAASVSTAGRCSERKRRCQPHAFAA